MSHGAADGGAGGFAHGEGDEDVAEGEAGFAVDFVFDFKHGVEIVGGNEVDGVVDAGEVLEGVDDGGRGSCEDVGVFSGDDFAGGEFDGDGVGFFLFFGL